MRVSNIGRRSGETKADDTTSAETRTPKEPADTPASPPSKASYAEKRWHKLSEEGRLQEWIELHEEIGRLQAEKRKLADEVARLKQRIAEFEADGSLGQKLGEALRKIDRIRGRSDEWQAEAARLKRQVLAQKKEIEQLRGQLERQEIPL
ncbi:MAG: hypothetical protein D6811_10765 [Alphaproteobacteria bacterium]|nr:MAG: hypothetical protein D6811_10765 [Alphaproteobacteria bacterium]